MSTGGSPPATYSNDTNIGHTPWDFVLTFSQLVAVPPDNAIGSQAVNEITKHTVGRLVMSPQHVRAFYRALGENIEKYERVFGEIPDVVTAAEKRAQELIREGVIPDPATSASSTAEQDRTTREGEGDTQATDQQPREGDGS